MRNNRYEIRDKAEIEKILSQSTIGRLATLGKDGFPYITPLNYVYWHGVIYFHSAPAGEKLDNIAAHPQVCFEVDIPLAYLDRGYDPAKPACAVSQLYQCVIIRGIAQVVDNRQEKVEALNQLMACHEKFAEFKEISLDTPAVAGCTVVAVRIESLTGKANLAQKKTAAEQDKICAYLEKRNEPGDRAAAETLKSYKGIL